MGSLGDGFDAWREASSQPYGHESTGCTRAPPRRWWVLARIKGIHHIFGDPRRSGTVTVAYHREGEEVPGTLRSIKKQAGWS